MHFEQKAKIHNYFDIEVVDAVTGKTKQTLRTYNIIVNHVIDPWCNKVAGNYEGWVSKVIVVGNGLGTPARTDTDLFGRKLSRWATTLQTVYDYPTGSVTKEIKIEANELVGVNITEVGFASGWSDMYPNNISLASHAMLQDSEGNQISINKTDTDIVYIRGTWFVTLQDGMGFGANGAYARSQFSTLMMVLLGVWQMDKNIYLCPINITDTTQIAGVDTYSLPDDASIELRRQLEKQGSSHSSKKTSLTPTYETMTLTSSQVTWLDSEANNFSIRSIGCIAGCFNLPDTTAFGDYPVTGIAVGTGDGSTKEFKIGCPIIKEDSETVYVNGVAKIRGTDYIVHAHNNENDAPWAYHSAQYSIYDDNIEFGNAKTLPLTKTKKECCVHYADPFYYGKTNFRGSADTLGAYFYFYMPQSIAVDITTPIFLDFTVAKACDTFKVTGITVPSAQVTNLVVEYSNDNITWIPVTNCVRTNQVWKFDVIKARYWRIYIPSYTWNVPAYNGGENKVTPFMFLGMNRYGLQFINPPASNDVITMDYVLDVPYKTSNNVLRASFSLQIIPGENS